METRKTLPSWKEIYREADECRDSYTNMVFWIGPLLITIFINCTDRPAYIYHIKIEQKNECPLNWHVFDENDWKSLCLYLSRKFNLEVDE